MSKTRKDKQGVAMITVAVVIFLSLFATWHILSASNDMVDQDTLCRIGKEDPVLKILVDKTDPWDEQGQKRLAMLVRNLKLQLAQHERLSIFILDESGTYTPSPVFDMCNPGRGDQASRLYQNPGMIQKRFKEQFEAPLDQVLKTLLMPGSAQQTPLLETIASLRSNVARERIFIFSDMLQNSSELSFYQQSKVNINNDPSGLCNLSSPYTEATVFYMNRPGITISKKQEIRNFWNNCLRKSSASLKWNNL